MDDPLGLRFEAAVRALDPILDAERARGNFGGRSAGDIHDRRQVWRLRHPIDIPALEAQFDFGSGIRLGLVPGGAVSFSGADGEAVFGIVGGERAGALAGLLRSRWWKRWRRDPRPRAPFANPFSDLTG